MTDVQHLVVHKFGLVRVITPLGRQFDLACGNRDRGLGDFSLTLRALDEQSWAVAEGCIREHGLRIRDADRFSRRQHAILMELARRDYLCYSRQRWTNSPVSSEKSG